MFLLVRIDLSVLLLKAAQFALSAPWAMFLSSAILVGLAWVYNVGLGRVPDHNTAQCSAFVISHKL